LLTRNQRRVRTAIPARALVRIPRPFSATARQKQEGPEMDMAKGFHQQNIPGYSYQEISAVRFVLVSGQLLWPITRDGRVSSGY
jgi:hypothetical protein